MHRGLGRRTQAFSSRPFSSTSGGVERKASTDGSSKISEGLDLVDDLRHGVVIVSEVGAGVMARLRKGMSFEDALRTPIKSRHAKVGAVVSGERDAK